MTVDEIMEVVNENGFDVTLSGGDPLQQPAEALAELVAAIKAAGFDIWCYTGYVLDEIIDRSELQPVFAGIDTIVDGPFLIEQRDISLRFRGSRNQRIIPLHGE